MKRIIAFVLMGATTATLSASGGKPVTLESRAQGARRVVVGRVADSYSTFGVTPQGDQVIQTTLQLEVDEVWKGAPERIVSLTIEGGTVGDLTNRISDMPTLKIGERGVFFLDQTVGSGHQPHLRGLGIVKVDEQGRVPGSQLTLDEMRDKVRGAVGGQR